LASTKKIPAVKLTAQNCTDEPRPDLCSLTGLARCLYANNLYVCSIV